MLVGIGLAKLIGDSVVLDNHLVAHKGGRSDALQVGIHLEKGIQLHQEAVVGQDVVGFLVHEHEVKLMVLYRGKELDPRGVGGLVCLGGRVL